MAKAVRSNLDIFNAMIQAKKELAEARGEVELAIATLHYRNASEVYRAAFGEAEQELLVHRAGSLA